MNQIAIPSITPTEAATYYSLIITGVIGGIGTLILAEKIKSKEKIPISSLAIWTMVFGFITAASVISITRTSR